MAKTTMNLRVDEALKTKAAKAAKADGRTLTNLVEKLLRDYLAAQAKER